jgi:hypothetical protein
MAPNLSSEQVNDRLCSYDGADGKVTEDLYQFGLMLVSEFVDRVHHLDSKAATLAAYSTGIVALMVSTSSSWRSALHGWAIGLVFAGALAAIFAAAFSLKAAFILRFRWFSDDEWFHEKYLEDAETLRRYRILTMHNIVESHRGAAEKKSNYIHAAQCAVAVSASMFFCSLVDAACKAWSV